MLIEIKKIFYKIKFLIREIRNILIYFLSSKTNKEKNVWVFGCWFGDKYDDNSRALFEYVSRYKKKIKAVWISKNKKVVDLIRKEGYTAYYYLSLPGIYYSLKAGVAIFNNGLTTDLFSPAITKPTLLINLWHGSPLKKIGLDNKFIYLKKEEGQEKNNFYEKLAIKFYNFLFPNNKVFAKKYFSFNLEKWSDYSLIIAASDEVKKNLISAFGVDETKVVVTGYPRNDVFFKKKLNNFKNDLILNLIKNIKKNGKKIVLYMPTHRGEGDKNIELLYEKSLYYLNNQLKKKQAVLFIKHHHYHLKKDNYILENPYRNIFILSSRDYNYPTYLILKYSDFLITDYSSVYFDYLLLNRPVIFTPFDYNDYLKNDREFYYQYEEVTPGPKAKSWEEVIKEIDKFVQFPNYYLKERIKINKIFNKYTDGKSCERVFKEVLKLLN